MTTWNTPSSDPRATLSQTTTPSENPTIAPTTWDQNTNTSNTTTTQTPTDEGTQSQDAQKTKPQSAQSQTAEHTQVQNVSTPKADAISTNTEKSLTKTFNDSTEIKKLQNENKTLKKQVEELTKAVNTLKATSQNWNSSEKQLAQAWDRKITVKNSDKSTETSKAWTETKTEDTKKTEAITETHEDSSDKTEEVVPWKSEAKQDKKEAKKSSNNTQQKEGKVWFWRRLGRWIKSWLSRIGSWIATWAKTVGNIVGYVPDKLSHWINVWPHAMSHPNGIFEKIGAVCSRPLRKGIELANLWLAGATKLFKRDSQELKTAWYQFRWKEAPNEESAKSEKKEDKIIKMDTAAQTKKAA